MERNYIKSIRPFLKELKPLETLPTPAQATFEKGDFKAILFDIYGTLLISVLSKDKDHPRHKIIWNEGPRMMALKEKLYRL
jgi:hypothetical protein